MAMPLATRIIPIDTSAAKDMFVSAVRFATSMDVPCAPFGDEIRTSAQEQVEYMLGEDEETSIIMIDNDVKSVVRMGVSKILSCFEKELASLILNSSVVSDMASDHILYRRVSDIEWMCNILPKMNLMKDFVANWAAMSDNVLGIIDDRKLDDVILGLKVKLIEVTAKVLEAIGYGNVTLPASCRLQLLKAWLPYIRKIKPVLDLKAVEDAGFHNKMDEDLCQSIEGAVVTLVLALPSNDQADILADWMKSENIQYPDLTEAFEVWSYRTKSARRRLTENVDTVGDAPHQYLKTVPP